MTYQQQYDPNYNELYDPTHVVDVSTTVSCSYGSYASAEKEDAETYEQILKYLDKAINGKYPAFNNMNSSIIPGVHEKLHQLLLEEKSVQECVSKMLQEAEKNIQNRIAICLKRKNQLKAKAKANNQHDCSDSWALTGKDADIMIDGNIISCNSKLSSWSSPSASSDKLVYGSKTITKEVCQHSWVFKIITGQISEIEIGIVSNSKDHKFVPGEYYAAHGDKFKSLYNKQAGSDFTGSPPFLIFQVDFEKGIVSINTGSNVSGQILTNKLNIDLEYVIYVKFNHTQKFTIPMLLMSRYMLDIENGPSDGCKCIIL